MCKTGCNNSISHHQRGYRDALKDLETIVDDNEKLDDSALLEKLYHYILDNQ